LGQTYPHVEIIVVDDGSTDDTRERLAKYGERIRYHYQPNAGLSAARNTGIGLAKGELIALLDSDDAFHPEKLAIQVQYLAEHPEISLVGSDYFSDEPRQWAKLPEMPLGRSCQIVTLEAIVVRSRFAASSALVRAECFQRVGPFDTTLKSVEDRDMWIRIASRDRIATIHLPLTWYRPTPGSMSRNAARMEHFEQVVLGKAFAMPELRRRWLLRQKALGLAAYSAAFMFRADGDERAAWQRMFSSFMRWPLPIPTDDIVEPFGRVRRLVRWSLAGATRR
jgi:glycosyltransferase involved in cell wall biosynthesis